MYISECLEEDDINIELWPYVIDTLIKELTFFNVWVVQ